ncbi:MAG: heme peroxidase [Alyxoria varia]|nr:MAG: heme peroxidase [Alyxoria varia]
MACTARLSACLARPATTNLLASIRRTPVRNAQLQTISCRSFHTTPRRLFPDPPKFPQGPSRAQRRAKGVGAGFGTIAIFVVLVFYFRSSPKPEESPDNEPFLRKQKRASFEGKAPGSFTPTDQAYQEVYNAIAKKLEDDNDYDDGSYGPVLLRLAWHASGTYDAATGTGGSNGATMRFAPEGDHGANSGLAAARRFLEPIHEKFPWISHSDLWILGAICAIQEMSGPTIPWRPGRNDRDASWCTPDGRLPDGAKDQSHLRAIFGRMGFSDQEIVALSGAHALGRCHTDRSGFDGPWTFSPITVTNDYYKLLLDEKWHVRKWDGPRQFQDGGTKSLMMLPTDMALIKDKTFKKWVEAYAKDEDKFMQDFGNVLCKLFELGVPFTTDAESRLKLRKTEEQE